MSPAKKDAGAPKKGERTRAKILDTALALFQEHGYEATTMRRIAEGAGVALGNAYYYFESKEHLIQGFYAKTHVEHLAACEPILAREKDLVARLKGVLHAKVDTAEPYHRISGVLFKSAADPKSPLSPFSSASAPVRTDAIELMRRVVDESDGRLPKDLAERLPEMLWLHEMAIILFWLHDESPGRARTRHLIDRTADLVAKLVSVASFPLMKPLRTSALELFDELKHDATPGA
ncbi:MAG: TetR family transcriptional regulator [Planctomycetes bacterium]|jgi:AcrR family transcriptional regulator|nr:TetR family transcriptional regulator [Planctomycetota bacterium]